MSSNGAEGEFSNPYFEEVAGGVTVGANRSSWSEAAVDLLDRRRELVEEFAWAIPNEAAIRTLVELDPILEVGAGTGYWAFCVEQAGGEIVAIDTEQRTRRALDTWTGVEPLSARNAIRQYGHGRALFVCWPNYNDRWAYNAVQTYSEIGGNTLVYVGEGRGGCTADDDFHELLHTQWTLDETVQIPTYLGVHDRLEVWRR